MGLVHIKGVSCPHLLLLKALSSLLRPQIHRNPGPGQSMGKDTDGEDEKMEALMLPVWPGLPSLLLHPDHPVFIHILP